MPDFADEGSELTELALQHALAAHRNRGRQLQPNGECYNCEAKLDKEVKVNPETGEPELDPVTGEEVLVDLKLYCDEFCKQDWEKRERLKKLG